MGIPNKSKLPPGPKPLLPFKQLIHFRRDSIAFLRNLTNEYGDIVYFKIGPTGIALLNHPDFIKEVLSTQHSNFIKGHPLRMTKVLLGNGILTSEGEFHKQHSQIIQPALHRKMIDSYAVVMTKCITDLMKGWEEGISIDVKHEMTRMSLAIAGRTLFSINLDHEADKIINALTTASEADKIINDLFGRVSVPFSEVMLKLPLPSTYRFRRAKAILDDTIYGMIDQRRKDMANHQDLLSMLLNAQKSYNNPTGLTDEQIRDEALTLFLTA
jgi:cytochrome P450